MVMVRRQTSFRRGRRSAKPPSRWQVKLEIASQDSEGQGGGSSLLGRVRKRNSELAVASKGGHANSHDDGKATRARTTSTWRVSGHLNPGSSGVIVLSAEGGATVKAEVGAVSPR